MKIGKEVIDRMYQLKLQLKSDIVVERMGHDYFIVYIEAPEWFSFDHITYYYKSSKVGRERIGYLRPQG